MVSESIFHNFGLVWTIFDRQITYIHDNVIRLQKSPVFAATQKKILFKNQYFSYKVPEFRCLKQVLLCL